MSEEEQQEEQPAAGASSDHLQAVDTHLQSLASDDIEEMDPIVQHEEWILKMALKNCIRNAQAWEANKNSGRGSDKANEAGAQRYRKLASAIQERLAQL